MSKYSDKLEQQFINGELLDMREHVLGIKAEDIYLAGYDVIDMTEAQLEQIANRMFRYYVDGGTYLGVVAECTEGILPKIEE